MINDSKRNICKNGMAHMFDKAKAVFFVFMCVTAVQEAAASMKVDESATTTKPLNVVISEAKSKAMIAKREAKTAMGRAISKEDEENAKEARLWRKMPRLRL
ncbi:hypothetical protein FACS189449_13190 [Alphaproteobacteria bacterium]|nr:hypothetical protein FACS189449_13190 [Alphaproteobacteria bacterium]